MEKLKQYVVFTVLGCLMVMAAGWFLLVSPKRSDAADLREQAETQVSSNARLENQLQILKAQAKGLPKQQAKLAAVAAKIPDNPALPGLVRALTTAAVSAGVELVTVTPSTPVAALPSAASAASTGASSSATAGTLSSIPLTLSVAGGYFQLEQFVANLESLPRAMRLTQLSMAPGANPVKPKASSTTVDAKVLSATINAQVYMAVNRPPATAVNVPGQTVAGTVVGPAAPVTPAKK